MALVRNSSFLDVDSHHFSDVLPVYNAARKDWKKAYSEFGMKPFEASLPELVANYPCPEANSLACLYETVSLDQPIHFLFYGTLLYFCLLFKRYDLVVSLFEKGYDVSKEFEGYIIDCSNQFSDLSAAFDFETHPAVLPRCGLQVIDQLCLNPHIPYDLRQFLLKKFMELELPQDVKGSLIARQYMNAPTPVNASAILLSTRDLRKIAESYAFDHLYSTSNKNCSSEMYKLEKKCYEKNIKYLRKSLFDYQVFSEGAVHFIFRTRLQVLSDVNDVGLYEKYLDMLYKGIASEGVSTGVSIDGNETGNAIDVAAVNAETGNAIDVAADRLSHFHVQSPNIRTDSDSSFYEMNRQCLHLTQRLIRMFKAYFPKLKEYPPLAIALLKLVLKYIMLHNQVMDDFEILQKYFAQNRIHFIIDFDEEENWSWSENSDGSIEVTLPGWHYYNHIYNLFPTNEEIAWAMLLKLADTAYCKDEYKKFLIIKDSSREFPLAYDYLLKLGIIGENNILFTLAYLDSYYANKDWILQEALKDMVAKGVSFPSNPLIAMYDYYTKHEHPEVTILDKQDSDIYVDTLIEKSKIFLYHRDDIYMYLDCNVIMLASGNNVYSTAHYVHLLNGLETVKLDHLQIALNDEICTLIIDKQVVRQIPFVLESANGKSTSIESVRDVFLDEHALKSLPPKTSSDRYAIPISDKDFNTLATYALLLNSLPKTDIIVQDFDENGAAKLDIIKGE